MRILYTPAGDTDPIRNYRDGGILHILRYYNPEKVFIFLSAEMTKKEEERKVYSKAVNFVAPQCEINFIKTDIVDVHHMENLFLLIDEFLKIRKSYPDSEILLNLSSGTPQMKTIMSFIATDFDNVRAIQVDSPVKGSNRSAYATQDNEDIDIILELNEDNGEKYNNRCSEPPLDMLHWYSVKHQINSLVVSFEYRSALKIYSKNRNLFSPVVGKLLQHAVYREDMMTKKALEVISKVGNLSLEKGKNFKVKKINEFLMIMELKQKKGQISEFLLKITPFLYALALYHLENNLKIKVESICDKGGSSGQWIVNKSKLNSVIPGVADALDAKFGVFRDKIDLSFSNLLEIFNNIKIENEYTELISLFNDLRIVERKYRNIVAHEINEINDDNVCSQDIMLKIRKAFFIVMKNEDVYIKNIYQELNNIIIKNLNEKF